MALSAPMNVQEYRKSLGYTLREMADLVGCSPSTIMRIEGGQTPQYETAEMLVEASSGGITLKDIYRKPPRRPRSGHGLEIGRGGGRK